MYISNEHLLGVLEIQLAHMMLTSYTLACYILNVNSLLTFHFQESCHHDHFFSEIVLTSHSMPSWRPKKRREIVDLGLAASYLLWWRQSMPEWSRFCPWSPWAGGCPWSPQHRGRVASPACWRTRAEGHSWGCPQQGGTEVPQCTPSDAPHRKNQRHRRVHRCFRNSFSSRGGWCADHRYPKRSTWSHPESICISKKLMKWFLRAVKF